MPGTNSTPFTIRLPNWLWEQIDDAGARVGMKRAEYLRRHLSAVHPCVPEVRKTNESVRTSNQAAEATEEPDWAASPLPKD